MQVADGESLTLREVPHSLTRDALQLAKSLSELGDNDEALVALIVKTLGNQSLPLRLRTAALGYFALP